MNRIVVGLQWGDEGKAKIVDILSEQADVIVRYQGGANAGHTVVIDGIKYVFHLVPTGMLYPQKIGVVAGGLVVDLPALVEEAKTLEKGNLNIFERLYLSDRAHLVMKYHKLLDEYEDERKGIGTTKRGIGPTYSDKISRKGIRLIDFKHKELFRDLVAEQLKEKNEIFKKIYGKPVLSLEEVLEPYESVRKIVSPLIFNTSLLLKKFMDQGKAVLFEGAQGTLLDIDWGTYPFVTSSNSSILGIPGSIGLGLRVIDESIGVTKAYTTRVGNGPFPTELFGETCNLIRGTGINIGDEFGATTGRPRRCGWLDLVALRHTCRVNGIDKLAITKLDVLDKIDQIKVCVKYKYKGEELYHFPASEAILKDCEPIYETYQGWLTSTKGITEFIQLPQLAQDYIKAIEKQLKVPVLMVSTGPGRKKCLFINN